MEKEWYENLVASECRAAWDGFHVVLNFPSPGCLSPPHLSPRFSHFLSFTSSPTTHVSLSPLSMSWCLSILYFLLSLSFIFHPCLLHLSFTSPIVIFSTLSPITISCQNLSSHHSVISLCCPSSVSHLSFAFLLVTPQSHLSFLLSYYPVWPLSPILFLPPSLLFPTSLSSPSLLGTLPYDIKIVIAGNHELTFDQEFMADLIKQDFYYFPSASKLKPENYENVQSLLTNCIYLQDSEVTVRGFRIYGSPWWVTATTAQFLAAKQSLKNIMTVVSCTCRMW